jgi:hypothetical protein
MSHGNGLDELAAALTAAGVSNELYHDCIHIPLSGGEAMVEVKSWVGGERSVQLFRGSECSNLTAASGEFECAPHEAAARLLQRLTERGLEVQKAGIGSGL